MLDRPRLASYIGHDETLERQFLVLLLDTLKACLAAMDGPPKDIYSALHAAKAGISVAASDKLLKSLQLACDLTANTSKSPLSAETIAALTQLRTHLLALQSDIETTLTS